MEKLVTALRAAAEPTRLRLLALCGAGELTVSELTQILGQSQPRVSRHLKLLCEAGLLERFREGSWAFYRLAEGGDSPEADRLALLARQLIDLIPAEDPVLSLDQNRLDRVRLERAEQAAAYFRANAVEWDRIRSLYVDDQEVETALLSLVAPGTYGDHLDIGTGTGQILIALAPRVRRSIGLDQSREMLGVARSNIAAAGLRMLSVRQGNMYKLPFPAAAFDLVTIHQVLHYEEEPAGVVIEASRVLRPGGRLIIVDFAPHTVEALRHDHAHRRLGFEAAEVEGWTRAAGLEPVEIRSLAGASLTVSIWVADRPQIPMAQAYRPGPSARLGLPEDGGTETAAASPLPAAPAANGKDGQDDNEERSHP